MWYFAPLVYQNTKDPRRDFLSKFEFDGDWDANNQKLHVDARNPQNPNYLFPLEGAVYYSVVEGPLHFFVGYSLYHPVDYKSLFGHENDFEGLLLTVERTASGGWGRLLVMETLAHDQFYQYYTELDIGDRNTAGAGCWWCEDRDAGIRAKTVKMENRVIAERPEVIVEAKGHGVNALGHDKVKLDLDSYVLYEPASRDQPGEDPTGKSNKSYQYALVELTSGRFWDERHASETKIFKEPFQNWNGTSREKVPAKQFPSKIQGKAPLLFGARPPWAWDDGDDACILQRGDWTMAPAFTMGHHLLIPNLRRESLRGPKYYEKNPFLEWGTANPPVDDVELNQCKPAWEKERERTTRRFSDAKLKEWSPGITMQQFESGPAIRVPLPHPARKRSDKSFGILWDQAAALKPGVQGPPQFCPFEKGDWPAGREVIGHQYLDFGLQDINTILLRFQNSFGYPAARIYSCVEMQPPGSQARVLAQSRLILLPSLTAFPREADKFSAEYRVDSVNDLFLELPPGHEPARLRSVYVEFTADLKEFGAASEFTDSLQGLPPGIPQLVREQYGVLLQAVKMGLFSREKESERPAIEIFTIEIQTRKSPYQVEPKATSSIGLHSEMPRAFLSVR